MLVFDSRTVAEVTHADATTWPIAALRLSLWTLSTPRATVFRILQRRARATIEGMFSGADGKHNGVLISDRASAFGFWSMALRQVRNAVSRHDADRRTDTKEIGTSQPNR